MTSIVFYFQVHQPFRLSRFSYFDIGKDRSWFDDGLNRGVLERVAERCYRPMNRLLKELIDETEGRFRCSMSLSGTVIQQLEAWSPETLQTFVDLAETGCVEFIGETAYHSLAALTDPPEFEEQVAEQRATVERLFGRLPRTFRDTELIIDNGIGARVNALGFERLLGEGWEGVLGERDAHVPYRLATCGDLSLLLRSYEFSDDIAFRFSNKEWPQHPLFADEYARWLARLGPEARFVGLFMDYETFGEHQNEDTGILDFMRHLPAQVLEHEGVDFAMPSEIEPAPAAEEEPESEDGEWPDERRLDIPHPVSWADAERDVTAWLGNPMQRSAHESLYALRKDVLATEDADLIRDWRRLTTSDHVYYMSTKWDSDGDVHEYFSPYDTPHDAYILFMNVVEDLRTRLATT